MSLQGKPSIVAMQSPLPSLFPPNIAPGLGTGDLRTPIKDELLEPGWIPVTPTEIGPIVKATLDDPT